MKGKLTMRNTSAVIILVHISNSIILGFQSIIGPDTWVSLLLSLIWVIPLMTLYARLIHLMPGKDLFQMLETLFGRTATAILCIFYAFYFMLLTGITRGHFSEFVSLTSLFYTPYVIINLAFFVVSFYLTMSGYETIGKWCMIMLVLAMVTYGAITVFSMPRMDPKNLLPVFGHGFQEYIVTSLKRVPVPMGEAVAVMCLMDGLDKKANPYKTYIISSILSTFLLIAMFLQTCAVLGADLMEKSYFPAYKAASVLHVGTIGSRVESAVAFAFILAGIAKVAVYLIASAKAVRSIFNTIDHRMLLLPVGFFTVAVSAHAFRSIVEMFDFVKVDLVYSLPFQVFIPLIAWITAEIKARKKGAPIPKVWEQAPQNAG